MWITSGRSPMWPWSGRAPTTAFRVSWSSPAWTGFTAPEIPGKLSLRASVTSELAFRRRADPRRQPPARSPVAQGPLELSERSPLPGSSGEVVGRPLVLRGGARLLDDPQQFDQPIASLPAHPGQARRHGDQGPAGLPARPQALRTAQDEAGSSRSISMGKRANARMALGVAHRSVASRPTGSPWSTRSSATPTTSNLSSPAGAPADPPLSIPAWP